MYLVKGKMVIGCHRMVMHVIEGSFCASSVPCNSNIPVAALLNCLHRYHNFGSCSFETIQNVLYATVGF